MAQEERKQGRNSDKANRENGLKSTQDPKEEKNRYKTKQTAARGTAQRFKCIKLSAILPNPIL
jgi:hypothetical protein